MAIPCPIAFATLHNNNQRSMCLQDEWKKIDFTRRDKIKRTEKNTMHNRSYEWMHLLRETSESHRNRLFMWTKQRASAAAAGFDRNLYATRSRSKFCESTTTTLSVEDSLSLCEMYNVFECTSGNRHQAMCNNVVAAECRPQNGKCMYQCRKIFWKYFARI